MGYFITFFQEQIKRRYINRLSWRRGGPALIKRNLFHSLEFRVSSEILSDISSDILSGQGKKKNEEIQRKAREAAAAEEARKAEEERQRHLDDQLSTKARGKKMYFFCTPKKKSGRNKKVTSLKRKKEKNIYIYISKAPCFLFFFRC